MDELVNATGRRHHEMGADVRELMELGIGMVGREGVVDRSGTAGACDVFDNDVRITQPPGVVTVMALRVGGHLVFALRPRMG